MLAKNERGSDRAYKQLLDMILDLRLPPGEVVNEQSLSEQLSLGRTPVHEAVARLVSDGFLDVLPRRGTSVTPLTLKNVLEIFEAREAVECGIAYIAASRATDNDLEQLEQLVNAADEARESSDTGLYLLTDFRVQRYLVGMINNSLLQDVGERLLFHNLRFWRLYFLTHAHSQNAMLSHRELLAALRAHDADRAQSAMREHIGIARGMLRELF